MTRRLLLSLLLLAGCGYAQRAERAEKLREMYLVGTISLGDMKFPVMVHEKERRRVVTVHVDEIRGVKRKDSWATILGHPRFLAVRDGTRGWRLSPYDLAKLGVMLEPGKTYRLTIGHRDLWETCCRIWNVLAAEEIETP